MGNDPLLLWETIRYCYGKLSVTAMSNDPFIAQKRSVYRPETICLSPRNDPFIAQKRSVYRPETICLSPRNDLSIAQKRSFTAISEAPSWFLSLKALCTVLALAVSVHYAWI